MVTYEKEALKALQKMQPQVAKRIRDKITELAKTPYAENNNASKLQGREGYRLRVGDWRVIYELKEAELIVMVLDIRPRGGAYKH